jgi:pimeloyl-ACP methyl ester carboxylesterase
MSPPWQSVPSTPTLPHPIFSSNLSVGNASLWYATYRQDLHASTFPPVVFLHGGHISSRWWSTQIDFLSNIPSQPYTIIAVDTRGHGRSTDDLSIPLSYDLLATDVIALLDHLEIQKASIVGWSDGANTALDLAMNFPSYIDRAFVFGANYHPSNANEAAINRSTTLPQVFGRVKSEYDEINPDPQYEVLAGRIKVMQDSLDWGKEDFAKIPTWDGDGVKGGWPLVWIVDGDKEELIKREATLQIHDWVCLSLFNANL